MKIKLNNGIEAEILSTTNVYYGVWLKSEQVNSLKYNCFLIKRFRTALTHAISHELEYYIDIYINNKRFIEFHRSMEECRQREDELRMLCTYENKIK